MKTSAYLDKDKPERRRQVRELSESAFWEQTFCDAH